MKQVFVLVMMLPLFLFAQNLNHVKSDSVKKGCVFEEELKWNQILRKAQSENKYIFIDCYATWCGPCKKMEREVFSVNKISNALKEKFISVRVQADTSNQDNEHVKEWYSDARKIIQRYKVTSFPTFLFFSPSGEFVHADIGYRDEDQFLALINVAVDSQKQLYTLIEQYKNGRKDYKKMPYLIDATRSIIKDKELATVMAQDYLNNHLYQTKDSEIFQKVNLRIMISYLQSSKEKGFSILYNHGFKIDKILGVNGSARSKVDYIITKEEIEPQLRGLRIKMASKIDPDWSRMLSTITTKYSREHAERTVLNAQIKWFDSRKDWPKLAESYLYKIEKYGIDTTSLGIFLLNNIIWEVIFLHSNDLSTINKGIRVMEKIIEVDSSIQTHIDTYANLLYKAGRISEAIQWEEKAEKLEKEKAERFNGIPNQIYKETLDKMMKGEPTWHNVDEPVSH
jgi:thioredoxin-related protein